MVATPVVAVTPLVAVNVSSLQTAIYPRDGVDGFNLAWSRLKSWRASLDLPHMPRIGSGASRRSAMVVFGRRSIRRCRCC